MARLRQGYGAAGVAVGVPAVALRRLKVSGTNGARKLAARQTLGVG